MAASGVAEHLEARRKEHVYLRKAFLEREKKAGFECGMGQSTNGVSNAQRRENSGAPTSYDYQLQRQQNLGRSGGHDAASVDQERRMAHLAQQQREYSAKIPNRYTSTDYKSQW